MRKVLITFCVTFVTLIFTSCTNNKMDLSTHNKISNIAISAGITESQLILLIEWRKKYGDAVYKNQGFITVVNQMIYSSKSKIKQIEIINAVKTAYASLN